MIIAPRSQGRFQLVRVLGVVVLISLLAALDIPLGVWLSAFAQKISLSSQYVVERVPLVASMWHAVTDRTSLAIQIQDLNQEKARTRALEAQVSHMEEQVELYRLAAKVSDSGSRTRIEGSLGWFSPSQNVRVAFIDRGSLDGVEVGDTVMRPPQIFIGVVSDISEHQARVRMAGDTLTQVPVRIQGTSVSGLLRTDTEFGLVVDYVERGEVITQGAAVVTSGDDRTAPALVVGSVLGIIQDPAKLFQVIRVVVDPQAHRSGPVFIVRQP